MRPLPFSEKGGVLLVKIDDEALNEGQAAGVRQCLYEALAARPTPRVAIDLTSVDHLTSTGIALLIGTKRRVDAAHGQLVIFGLIPEIFDLFSSMKLTTLFEISTDETQALTLFPSLPAS